MDRLRIGAKSRIGDLAKKPKEGTFIESGLDLVLSLLAQETGEIGISIGAIGTGSPTSTALGNEVGRKTIAGISNTADGKLFSIFFSADYPGSEYTISEVALIGGSDATEASGGTTVAVTSLSPPILKSPGTHTLTIDYELYKA